MTKESTTQSRYIAALFAGLSLDQRRTALWHTHFEIDMNPDEFGVEVEALDPRAKRVIHQRLVHARGV